MKIREEIIQLAESKIFQEDILKISELITQLYEDKITEIYKQEIGDVDGICLAAFGSFGRKTMAPCSDIDFIILTSSTEISDKFSNRISSFIAKVWDVVSKAEFSVRTPAETMKIALEDVKVLSYLSDIRFIAGDLRVFNQLIYILEQEKEQLKIDFFSKIAQDRKKRISKFKVMSEPDLKKSPGGLDDFFFINSLSKLITDEVFVYTDEIKSDFKRVLETRFILHILQKRNSNVIHSGIIEEILNFKKRKTGKVFNPRDFMTKIISSMQRIKVYADIAQNFVKKKIFPQHPELITSLGKDYISDGEFIYADIESFKKEPWRMVEIFKLAKENNLEIAPETAYQMLKIKNVNLTHDQKANEIFLDIMTDLGGIAKTLMKMKELGVLEKIIPEFSKVSNLYQLFPPHIYPVGTHLIKCVEETEKILSGIRPQYIEILPDFAEIDKKIIFLSAFLHDIGKGSRQDHSEVGEKLTEKIAQRLGIVGYELERLKFIVKNHLSLSHFSQRRDMHDTSSLEKFVSSFPDRMTLNTLYIITIADAIATNPSNWNEWKAHLIQEVYSRADEMMRKGLEYTEEERIDILMLSDELKNFFPAEIVDNFVSSLSQKFLSFFNYDRLFRYSMAFLKAYTQQKEFITYTKRDEGVIEIVVIGKDSQTFIAECAGTLFLSGFNILSLFSESGVMEMAINIFWVQPPDKSKAEKFKKMFYRRDLKEIILKVQEKRKNFGIEMGYDSKTKKYRRKKEDIAIVFDNNFSENYTIVEVYCSDRPGLLFDISCAILFSGFEISVAKISTRENKVADIFYIRDRAKMKKLSEEQCAKLKIEIEKSITQGVQLPLQLPAHL